MTDERTCRCKGQFAMHKPALHADRDGSEARAQLEREHEHALAAYVPEPASEPVTLAEHGRHVRDLMRGIYSADIADLMAERDRLRQGLWDAWAALGHDTDGDTGPGALIAGMGVDGFIRMVIDDAARYRRESEEDYDADTDRLKARAEKAEAALARVETVHIASGDGYCLGCWEGGGEDGALSWPCPTIRAIGAAS